MPSGSEIEDVNEDDKPSKNVIAHISQFADDNLTIVRITKFGSATDIPARFIERNISIRGRLRNITENGLEVEHLPIYVPLLSRLLTKPGQSGPVLDVRLAGVEMTSEGHDWIAQQLKPAETLWLRLISRQNQTLHCLVSVNRGSLLNTCVNEELLRLGLARTSPLLGLDPQSRISWSLYKRLMRAESKAEKKGKGLWKEESRWERVSDVLRNNMLLVSVKKLFKWTSRTKEK
ncbi:protein C3orf33 homolog isoform X2 [Siphateles boraxobius]|uniref:protein C3orf33 homolog isoform X2 n=1 Tax=Siphateles boraxobius TaxID=180520 RepID=UPI0040632A92